MSEFVDPRSIGWHGRRLLGLRGPGPSWGGAVDLAGAVRAEAEGCAAEGGVVVALLVAWADGVVARPSDSVVVRSSDGVVVQFGRFRRLGWCDLGSGVGLGARHDHRFALKLGGDLVSKGSERSVCGVLHSNGVGRAHTRVNPRS